MQKNQFRTLKKKVVEDVRAENRVGPYTATTVYVLTCQKLTMDNLFLSLFTHCTSLKSQHAYLKQLSDIVCSIHGKCWLLCPY